MAVSQLVVVVQVRWLPWSIALAFHSRIWDVSASPLYAQVDQFMLSNRKSLLQLEDPDIITSQETIITKRDEDLRTKNKCIRHAYDLIHGIMGNLIEFGHASYHYQVNAYLNLQYITIRADEGAYVPCETTELNRNHGELLGSISLTIRG
jgi:hypothetical protein